MKITSKIIDAHMHLSTNYQSFTEKKKALLDEMDRNGICKGIIISDSELVSNIGNLKECTELFDDCDRIAVVGGISPFINFDEQYKMLESFITDKKIAGIKLYCGHEPIFLNDKALKLVYRLAERYDLPILFHSGWDNSQYSSPEIIKDTAEKYSSIRLICCHCCYPNLKECFDVLAKHDNVQFDISSVADGDAVNIKHTLEKAIHKMPERFIFGSDYGCCNQAKHIEFCNGLDISDYEKEMLFYKNAEQIYFGK